MLIKSKFITKLLKKLSSWKKSDLIIINKQERKLQDKKVVMNVSGLDAEREALIISGSALIYGDSFDKAIILAVNFFDKQNKKLVINPERQSLALSKKYGYYRYLPASRAGAAFNLMLVLPPTCHRVKIDIVPKSGVPVILGSGATVRRVKSSDPDKFAEAVRALEGIESRTESYEQFANPQIYERALKRIFADDENAADLARLYEYLNNAGRLTAPGIGRLLYRANSDLSIAKSVQKTLTEFGHLVALNDFIVEVTANPPPGWSQSNKRVSDDVKRLRYGYEPPLRKSRDYQPGKNTLYLLHNSLPYNSGGYATRTHGLLTGIRKISPYIPHAISRPGFPTDHQKYISKKLPDRIPVAEDIDGIEYIRCDQKVRRSHLTTSDYIDVFAEEVRTVARQKKAAVVHAASNFPNGIAAARAAHSLGLPVVYEVRGLWEITRMSRQLYWDKTDQFHMMARAEADACKFADHVITITHALKDLMVSRGVDSSKITVVPNCVHTDLFTPSEHKDAQLLTSLDFDERDVVIGYVGSVVNYEGLKDLLKAVAILRERQIERFKVLIVGDGAVLDDLVKQCQALELQKHVVFTGRVPHSEVQRYYSLIDITPFPREPFLVCELVSPLKPFEALASAKTVLVSSCAALTEIIEDRVNGRVFEKGNVTDLADKLEELIGDHIQRSRLAKAGREWVVSERDWRNAASIVTQVYDSLSQ
ncbi:glycosyltransferase [Bordetella petrii]|uniref:glycosyltransferase n=1 Tax=Bordetella petrii TaxID=94624 RepID=UPI001E4350AD|nr:glycosyltransferase [Bordetella petrii]MCD0501721.1 glycosyltransferase family 4 protein [Bordetella petrii]